MPTRALCIVQNNSMYKLSSNTKLQNKIEPIDGRMSLDQKNVNVHLLATVKNLLMCEHNKYFKYEKCSHKYIYLTCMNFRTSFGPVSSEKLLIKRQFRSPLSVEFSSSRTSSLLNYGLSLDRLKPNHFIISSPQPNRHRYTARLCTYYLILGAAYSLVGDGWR